MYISEVPVLELITIIKGNDQTTCRPPLNYCDPMENQFIFHAVKHKGKS